MSDIEAIEHAPAVAGRYAIVPGRIVDDREIGSGAVLVLVALCTYADRDGYCWPSAATLAKRLGIRERQVRKCLQQLTRGGYIETSREYRENGKETVALRHIVGDLEAEENRRLGVSSQDTLGVSSQDTLGVSSQDRQNIHKEQIIDSAPPSAVTATRDNPTRRSENPAEPTEFALPLGPVLVIDNPTSAGNVVSLPKKSRRKPAGEVDPAIAEASKRLFAIFPRRSDSFPGDAAKAYAKALRGGASHDQIERGVRNYTADFEAKTGDPEFAHKLSNFISRRDYLNWQDARPTASRRRDNGAL